MQVIWKFALSTFTHIMRSSRMVRASDSQCRLPKLQLSRVQSQHPPTQGNLRGGRLSSVELSTEKIQKNSPFKKISHKIAPRERKKSCNLALCKNSLKVILWPFYSHRAPARQDSACAACSSTSAPARPMRTGRTLWTPVWRSPCAASWSTGWTATSVRFGSSWISLK